jgi:ribose 5-phosphate isomerase B
MSVALAFGSDHKGFVLKEFLLDHFDDLTKGHDRPGSFVDVGCFSKDSVDYNDYAVQVAGCLRDRLATHGVLICNSGIGISMAANRYPWVRAALCHDIDAVRQARQHNDANVLVLGAAVITPELALAMLQAFLTTDFEGAKADGQRHQRRVDKLSNPA